jgi:DNA helicase IV
MDKDDVHIESEEPIRRSSATPAVHEGLEFDAVVVVEPTIIMEEDQGPRRLYVAFTRAVQHLSIVHEKGLPEVLQTTEVA